MSTVAAITRTDEIDAIERELDASPGPQRLLALAERILALWVEAHGAEPTHETREGFRLLALHHQGTRGIPSFNACRETCREIAYHFNLLGNKHETRTLEMMERLVVHLELFVSGKMEVERLGEFCCSSRPLRTQEIQEERQHA